MDQPLIYFIQNSPDAVAVVKPDGSIRFANSKFSDFIGPAPSRKHAGSLFDHPLPSPFKRQLKQAFKRMEESGPEENFNHTSKEDNRPVSFACRVIPISSKGTLEIIVEIRDETRLLTLKNSLRRRKASHRQEALLKERRRKLFFNLFEELPTFIYLQRRDYTVAFANRRVRKLYGEAQGRLCYEVFAGRTSPCPACPTFEVFETGESVEWEFTDNNGRSFLIYDYPFEDEDGEPLVLEMGVDITDLKTVEKELFQAQKLRAIGVLAGGIAHDLNNNLVPIIFNVEYARTKVENLDLTEALDEALEAANRASSLVAQVLEYSRQQDVNRKTLHLPPLLRACIKDFKSTLSPRTKLHTDLRLPSCSVLANATQIQQVFTNLLHNAQQAMPDAGGTIHISLDCRKVSPKIGQRVKDLSPGSYAALKVKDTGQGIPPDDLEKIFDPFFTTKRNSGGIGMGLAAVHSIVRGCKGEILVESTPGQGTLFTVLLPMTSDPQTALEGQLCYLRGENIQLLLVDDDPGPLTAMARVLRQAGFLVDTAASGKKGLALFRKNPDRYQLVLADHAMPGMSGLEMARRMMDLEKKTKIVICTGHIEPDLEEEAKKEGVSGVAFKPMSPNKLIEVVRQHCV
ncbi:PAS domain S-box protein [delta proteobacterium NaphS2]|nr:PAS domain S-box protein [delta proteobacterium NaphS2]